jgi:hypothetical protein
MCRRRSGTGSRPAAFSGHSASFRPGRGEESRKPASSHSRGSLEAVEVEVRWTRRPGQAVGLHHGVGRALDAALHAQRAQQVAHEGGLAGAQRAVQFDEGLDAQRGRAARAGGEGGAGGPRRARWRMRVSRIGKWVTRGAARASGRRSAAACTAALLPGRMRRGFSQIGVADVDLSGAEPGLLAWLDAGFHGRWPTWPRTA